MVNNIGGAGTRHPIYLHNGARREDIFRRFKCFARMITVKLFSSTRIALNNMVLPLSLSYPPCPERCVFKR